MKTKICKQCKSKYKNKNKIFCSQHCFFTYKHSHPAWNRGLHDTRSIEGIKKWRKSLKGRHTWNKGLTKYTNDSIKRMSENYPKHRKSPILSDKVRSEKIKRLTGKNNPNYNPNKSEFEKYKLLCQFDFDLGKYPNEFSLEKIKNMFHPFKNKHGYTRDHILSIFYGFKNNVDYSKVKHPANCKLLTHSENSRKNKFENITEQELDERIKKWNKKYKKYKGL